MKLSTLYSINTGNKFNIQITINLFTYFYLNSSTLLLLWFKQVNISSSKHFSNVNFSITGKPHLYVDGEDTVWARGPGVQCVRRDRTVCLPLKPRYNMHYSLCVLGGLFSKLWKLYLAAFMDLPAVSCTFKLHDPHQNKNHSLIVHQYCVQYKHYNNYDDLSHSTIPPSQSHSSKHFHRLTVSVYLDFRYIFYHITSCYGTVVLVMLITNHSSLQFICLILYMIIIILHSVMLQYFFHLFEIPKTIKRIKTKTAFYTEGLKYSLLEIRAPK